MISPDGKWVAYASDESGNWEIYVTTFPAAEGKWQVSRGGGTQPRWRAAASAEAGMVMAAVPASSKTVTVPAGVLSPSRARILPYPHHLAPSLSLRHHDLPQIFRPLQTHNWVLPGSSNSGGSGG